MCGIAGFLNSRDGWPGERLREVARRMGRAIQHRGPDDDGLWCDEQAGVAFAHQRLAILDLSEAGHQPMQSDNGRFVICFNGEIYNHLSVRAELEALGRAPAWRGHSDTETMLAAFTCWGLEQSVRRFVGMFAFALWDRQTRTLHLCRDRLGEKPLYYGWLGRTLVFGSELKALRRHPAWHGTIDRGALALYVRHNYVPAPYSIYMGVQKLLPGTILTLKWRETEADLNTYWSALEAMELAQCNRYTGSESEAAQHLEYLLQGAVREQMVADVPLGAFLSGGVDSSLGCSPRRRFSLPPRTTSLPLLRACPVCF